jgi:2'-5' RNA ligase
MNKKKLNHFLIAIIPPLHIESEIYELKEYFKANYNSRASLNSPPHITLHMPFDWKEEKTEGFVEDLTRFSETQNGFSIELKDFGSFAPRVIFVDVLTNPTLLTFQKELHRFCKKEFNLFNAQYRDLPYHPHITLAFRDLKKPEFFKAWKEFEQRTYSATFEVNGFTLLRHDGKQWRIFKEFYFKPT